MKPVNNHSKKEQGMTFIEVLVALVILVTGILGAVAMQATAKKGSFDALQRSLASSLAQDIIERMRSNDAMALVNYAGTTYGQTLDAAPGKRCNSSGGACTVAEMTANDLYEWEVALMGADVKKSASNAGGLIDASACIFVAGATNNQVTVVITWQGRTEIVDGNTENCGATDNKRRQVLVEAFIY